MQSIWPVSVYREIVFHISAALITIYPLSVEREYFLPHICYPKISQRQNIIVKS